MQNFKIAEKKTRRLFGQENNAKRWSRQRSKVRMWKAKESAKDENYEMDESWRFGCDLSWANNNNCVVSWDRIDNSHLINSPLNLVSELAAMFKYVLWKTKHAKCRLHMNTCIGRKGTNVERGRVIMIPFIARGWFSISPPPFTCKNDLILFCVEFIHN